MLRVSRFAIVALLAASVSAPSRAAEVDSLLPKETEFVLQINVRQTLESDIIKKYALAQMKQTLEGKDAQKLLKDLGLDPMKDVDKVTMGAWGKDKDDMNGVVIVRGTFDAKKIMDSAQTAAKDMADKVSIVKEGDLELIKFTGDQGKPGYLAVIEGKPIIGGTDKKIVAAAVKASNDNAKPALSKELTALVLKQDTKASVFACGITEGKVGDIPGDFSQLKALGVDGDKIKAGLGKMSNLSLSVIVGKDVSVAIKLGMKDKDSADDFGAELAKVVTAAKTFLPLAGANQPLFKALIEDVSKTLDSVSKEKDVVVTVKVTAEAIGKAAGGGDDKEKDKDK
jgi:hypothetical protein